MKGAARITYDFEGCFMTIDHSGWYLCECSHYAGCSDIDIEGTSSSINDGDPVVCTTYLCHESLKIHAVEAIGSA